MAANRAAAPDRACRRGVPARALVVMALSLSVAAAHPAGSSTTDEKMHLQGKNADAVVHKLRRCASRATLSACGWGRFRMRWAAVLGVLALTGCTARPPDAAPPVASVTGPAPAPVQSRAPDLAPVQTAPPAVPPASTAAVRPVVRRTVCGKPVDVNTATVRELECLHGIGEKRARAIVAGRPYRTPADIKTRRIIPASIYDRNAALLR